VLASAHGGKSRQASHERRPAAGDAIYRGPCGTEAARPPAGGGAAPQGHTSVRAPDRDRQRIGERLRRVLVAGERHDPETSHQTGNDRETSRERHRWKITPPTGEPEWPRSPLERPF